MLARANLGDGWSIFVAGERRTLSGLRQFIEATGRAVVEFGDVERLAEARALWSAIDRSVRRLQLLCPTTREEFEKSLWWMIEQGNKEDLELIRRVRERPPYFSLQIEGWFGHAERSINRRAEVEAHGSATGVVMELSALSETGLPPHERSGLMAEGGLRRAEVADQQRAEVFDKLTHELCAPAAAIRSTAAFLRRRIKDLPDHIVERKLDDLMLDAEMLLLQVAEAKHFLGGEPPRSTAQRTLIYRDVVIKTVNQLKPMVAERGFDFARIKYDVRDIPKLILDVDRIRLNQVVFNLLINAIKYAEPDPEKFLIRMALDETRDRFILKFEDWGIGIRNEFVQRIFEPGFRTPEAENAFVSGTGLGLTISRAIMRELGGDLILEKTFKPTEFRVILPKPRGRPRYDTLR